MNLSEITNLWVYWNRLTKQTYQNNVSEDHILTWTNWFKQWFKERYEGRIFDFDINVQKKKREKKEAIKQKFFKTNESNLKDQIEGNLEWLICFNQISLTKNLQCLFWKRTFWFDWLTSWIYKYSTCPNWRKTLNKEKTKLNKEIGKIIKMPASKPNKEDKILWKIHHEEWTLYWDSWDIFVWNKCVAQHYTNKHRIIGVEDVVKELLLKSTNELENNKSFLFQRNQLLKYTLFWSKVNDQIFEEIVSWINQSVDKYKKELQENKKHLDEIVKKEANSKIYLENQNDLYKWFKSSKQINLVSKVSRSIKNARLLKELYSHNNTSRWMSESGMVSVERNNWNMFKYSVSKLYRLSIEEIKLNEDQNVSITIINKMQNNELKIFISSKDLSAQYMYSYLTLESNPFWTLCEENIIKIHLTPRLLEIGKLKLKDEVDEMVYDLEDNRNLTFSLNLCTIDQNLNSYISKTQDLVIDRIEHDLREWENIASLDNSKEEYINLNEIKENVVMDNESIEATELEMKNRYSVNIFNYWTWLL